MHTAILIALIDILAGALARMLRRRKPSPMAGALSLEAGA